MRTSKIACYESPRPSATLSEQGGNGSETQGIFAMKVRRERLPRLTGSGPVRKDAIAQLASRALFAAEKGSWADAIHAARSILREDQNHIPALEVLATALWRTGHIGQALRISDRLVRLNPYEPGYFHLRGSLYEQLGRYADAVYAYRRAIESSRDVSFQNRVEQSLEILEQWEATLVAQLLEDDLTFACQYQMDPVEACRSRGFEFSWHPREWSRPRHLPVAHVTPLGVRVN